MQPNIKNENFATLVHDNDGFWEVWYLAPKGYRLNSQFDSVTVRDDIWFDSHDKTWKSHSECQGSYSTHHSTWEGSPRTFKAFLNYLKKHTELKGHEVVLVNRTLYQIDENTVFETHVVANYVFKSKND